MKMYSSSSPVLSNNSQSHHSPSISNSNSNGGGYNNNNNNNNSNQHHHHSSHFATAAQQHHQRGRCLKFKYFATFLLSTICLALLSASLATHKWIVSKPIRILRLNGAQTNFTSLMLTAQGNHQYDDRLTLLDGAGPINSQSLLLTPSSSLFAGLGIDELMPASGGGSSGGQIYSNSQHNKFQGEIYFGLFKGVKVLNYGFGDRVSQITVLQAHSAQDNQQQELINFKLWLVTLTSVCLAILFALIGSIFAIINFVMTPRGKLTGPIGLVIWNATACFACLLALVTWFIEYFIRLQTNVLTLEEVQNGWTSENRSQFGYSYYLVLLAFVLHLVNIFVVSIVQFETWSANTKAAKRQSRSVCEGVIMLY